MKYGVNISVLVSCSYSYMILLLIALIIELHIQTYFLLVKMPLSQTIVYGEYVCDKLSQTQFWHFFW